MISNVRSTIEAGCRTTPGAEWHYCRAPTGTIRIVGERPFYCFLATGPYSAYGARRKSVEVRNVSRAGDQLRIEVLETYPSSGCTTTQARTQPVDVVMVSAAGVKGWSFIDSRAVGTC